MEDKKIQQINSILWAAVVSVNFFWILNILKESYKGVKAFLNFYPAVGPLLGLFIFSGLVFIIAFLILVALKPKNQKLAFWAYLISVIAFFFMVFPPVWEPIVDVLVGK